MLSRKIAGVFFVCILGIFAFGCESEVNSVTFTITAIAGANGSISPEGEVEVTKGADQKFTIIPDADFVIDDVLVDGASVGAVDEYTFTGVSTDHKIEASFIRVFTITASSSINGSIVPDGAVLVKQGAEQLFTFNPDSGFAVTDVLIDGSSVGTPASITFANVDADHTIHVSFLNTYRITVMKTGNGTIFPNGSVPVDAGADQNFTIAADTNWVIHDVLVDGKSVGAVSNYYFQNVQQSHTIHAIFASVNTDKPSNPVRLVFMHHSCGNNWLNTGNGNLGDELGNNNYYVRDTYYGWDALLNTDIGSNTDIGHWYTWFADTTLQSNSQPRRDNILSSLYTTSNKNANYNTTLCADPGGENTIIMFKSCYPNSNVYANNTTQPTDLFGQACGIQVSGGHAHTLENTQAVYREILKYFKTKTNKMFVVITAPPLVQSSTTSTRAGNARALNNWLVNEWLKEADWENKNVYVFDFYNVLTADDNHHRINGGKIEHITINGDNYANYFTGTDSHPTSVGNQKSTCEYVPLLNVYYHRWWNDYLGN